MVNTRYTPQTHTHTGKEGKVRDQPYLEKRFPWQHPLVDPKRSSYRGLEEFPMRSSRREEKQREQEEGGLAEEVSRFNGINKSRASRDPNHRIKTTKQTKTLIYAAMFSPGAETWRFLIYFTQSGR